MQETKKFGYEYIAYNRLGESSALFCHDDGIEIQDGLQFGTTQKDG